MRTVVFINAHSRQAQDLASQVVVEIPKVLTNHEIIETIVVKKLNELDNCLKKLHDNKQMQCVIVGSGDGTLIAVLNALKGRRNITYGFLPLGTSNTFVRSLELPDTYPEALQVIKRGNVRKASLGEVNGKLFANMLGIGLPVRVSDDVTNRTKKMLGTSAYVISGLKELSKHKAFHCEIRQGKSLTSFYTHHLLIANGPFHGNIRVSKQLSAYDDTLKIVSFGTDKSKLRYAKSMIRFGLDKHLEDPDTKIFTVNKARIMTEPKRKIEADGEIISSTPADIQIKKSAISVFAPAE